MKHVFALLALVVVPGITFAQTIQRSGSPAGARPTQDLGARKSVCDTTWLFQTAGVFPTGLATDGFGYWVADVNMPEIHRVDLNGSFLSSLAVPTGGAAGLYFDGIYLWAVLESDGALVQYDPTLGTVLANYTLPFQSADNNHWGVAGETGALWVSVYGVGGHTELLKIDPATGTVMDTVELAQPTILGLIVLNGDLYGIDLGSQSLLELDRTTGAVLSTTPWCLPYPLGVAWSAATGLVGVSSNSINGGVQRVIRVNNGPTGITDQMGAEALHVYPVPASDLVTIDLPNRRILGARLVDVSGREVLIAHLSSERVELPVAELRAGPYIVEVDDGRVLHRVRVLVTH
ncbi:MAG: hypothetical protein WAU70_04645 [Flavobacteriales bacterium]